MKHFTFFNQTNYSFEGKKEGEQVILFLHRHWFIIIHRVVMIFLATLLPFVVIFAFGQLLIQYNVMAIFACLWGLYYLLLWFILFYIFTIYNLNNWIVTNLRIIDRHQIGLFDQSVSELNLINIQDVSFSMDGFVATTMNYGCLEVQTAGRDSKFLFQQIPNPQFVKDEIMKIAAHVKGNNGLGNQL